MQPKPSAQEPMSDPLLDAEVERAIAPYRGKVSGEMLAYYRERLREALLFHPVGRRLLNRARPVPALQNSDELVGRGPNAGQAAATPQAGGKAKASGQ